MRALGIVAYAVTLAACGLFVPIDEHELAPPVLASTGGDGGGGTPSDQDGAVAESGADALIVGADAVLVDQQASPTDLFTFGPQVYWVSSGDRTIRSSPKSTPQAQLLRTTAGGVRCLVRLNGLNMAWCEGNQIFYGTLDGKGGGARAYFGNDNPLRIAVAPNQIYASIGNGDIWELGISTGQVVLANDPGTTAVAYGGSAIFWANPTKSRTMKFDRPAGPAVEFARNQIGPVDVATDDTHAYWLTDVAVMKLDRATPLGVPVEVAGGQKSPTRMALDATNVYWTNGGANTVMTVPKAGGTPTPIGTCVNSPFGIAVDDDGVYFTCPIDGTVKVATKR